MLRLTFARKLERTGLSVDTRPESSRDIWFQPTTIRPSAVWNLTYAGYSTSEIAKQLDTTPKRVKLVLDGLREDLARLVEE